MIMLTLVRWILAAQLEITPGEAMLWLRGERPALAGFDGGGLAAFLVRAGTAVFGQNAFGVRFFAPLCAAAASLVLYRLARSLAGEKSAAWAVALVNVTPVWNLGAIFLRPETPAVLLVLCGISAVWRALRRAATGIFFWALAGIFFGTAFLFWHGAALAAGGAFVLLAASRRWRGQLRRAGPWLMLADFLLCVLPVWHWNGQNADAGRDAWLERAGLASFGLHPLAALRTLGLCALLTGPVMLLQMLAASRGALRALSDARRPDVAVFATAWAGVFGAAAMIAALCGSGSGADLALVLPMLAILLGWWWETHCDDVAARLRWQAAVMLPALISTPLVLHSDLARHAGLQLSYQTDPSRDWRGWRQTAAEAERTIREAAPQAPGGLVLMASDWQLAAVLNFYLPRDLPVYRVGENQPAVIVLESAVPTSQFSFWPRADTLRASGKTAASGRNVLLFSAAGEAEPQTAAAFQRACSTTAIQSVADIRRGPWLVRRLTVRSGVWR